MVMTLFLLVSGGAIAYFIWNFRKKSAEREAATKKRFEEMFLARPASAPAHDAPQAPAPVAVPVSVAVPEIKPPASVVAAPVSGRFLGQRETLLYRLLKVGIPDHEIFANVALASVAGGRNEQETRRLAQYCLDFVVCDKNMRVVAAVEFEPAGGAQAISDQHFKVECLKAAGINLVRVNPAALPRRDAIRGLVCGQPGARA
jgi:hypothetical protein